MASPMDKQWQGVAEEEKWQNRKTIMVKLPYEHFYYGVVNVKLLYVTGHITVRPK
jgi:hypothetical protein